MSDEPLLSIHLSEQAKGLFNIKSAFAQAESRRQAFAAEYTSLVQPTSNLTFTSKEEAPSTSSAPAFAKVADLIEHALEDMDSGDDGDAYWKLEEALKSARENA